MKHIVFCGGGSAGHVMPNIAIIEDVKEQYSISYIGTCGIEKSICESYGVPFYTLTATKLIRGKIIDNLSIPIKLLSSIKQAKKILKEIKPDLVFSKGGYVSLPVAISARLLKIPVISHESDISPGLANKLIKVFSTRYISTFPSIKGATCVGAPMLDSLFKVDKTKAKQTFLFDNRPTILVFGGGSGAKSINNALRGCIKELCATFNVLHVCGKGNIFDNNIYGYKQVEFIDMGIAYACADLAVARCGSNSACELTALKIPTLYIPLQGKHSRGDQVKNAQYFLSLNVCHVLKESQLTPSTLYNSIMKLYGDYKLKNTLKDTCFKRGNNNIKKVIEKVLKG